MNKSEFNTTRREIIDPICDIFPPLGGMTPMDSSPQIIRNAFRGREKRIQIAGPMVLAALENISAAAKNVGLNVTVNNLRRAVNGILNIAESNDDSENGKPLFPQLYKGVSFNPKTYSTKDGKEEWLMILDFFAMMRTLQQSFSEQDLNKEPIKFAIFDAGLYWIVNLLGKEGIKTTAETAESAAKEIISQLREAVQKSEGSETYDTALVRNSYLEAIAEQFPANMRPPIFNLLDIWNEPGFEEYLARSLSLFCEKDVTRRWQVKKPVKYERYMPYSPWVTPLVAAEQALMGDLYGFRANLAPTSEAAWNSILDTMCRSLKIPPYIIWGYLRTIAENLPYESIPSFCDGEDKIEQKLFAEKSQDVRLPELASRLVAPFIKSEEREKLIIAGSSNDTKSIAPTIAKFISTIEKRAQDILRQTPRIPQRSLSNTGWLMQFPAGSC